MKNHSLLGELKIPAKASVSYLLSSLVGKALGILSLPLFTRLLSEEEYGVFALYMATLGFMSLVASIGYSGSIIYKGLQRFSAMENEYISASLGIYFIFSLTIFVTVFLFRKLINLPDELLPFLYIQLLFDGVVGIYLSHKKYRYHYRSASLISIVLSVFSPFIGFLLIKYSGMGYFGRITGLILPSAIVGSIIAFMILKRSRKLYEREVWKYMVKQTLPLIPASLSSAAVTEGDKLIFSAFLGARAVAKYSVAHTLGLGLSFVTAALGSAVYPWVTRRLKAGEKDRISEITSLILTLLGATSIFLIALAPELMAFLAPRGYSEAVVAVAPIALSLLPSFVSSIASVGFVYVEKSRYTSISSILGAVLNILLNLLLIPEIEYFGAGIATLISSLCTASLNVYFLKKCSLLEMAPKISLMPTLLLIILPLLFMMLLYNYAALRIVLLIPPAIFGLSALFSTKKIIAEK